VNCETVQSEQVVERYVLGQLGEAEQQSFEEHFFDCDACLEEVRMMQSLQAAAAERGRPVVEMPRRKWMLWGAAAAVLVAGFGLVEIPRVRQRVAAPVAKAPTVDAGAELLVLARVTAPQYTASNLRSASGNGEERFRAAMAKYSAGEYAAAAEGLRGMKTAAARFYLGIAELMTGNLEEAVTHLRDTAAMGETPYLEEAQFFLAKALLGEKNVAGAAVELEQTIALRGDREAEARRLLEQVRALPVGR
jgi:tetratricopeptide (TPR) repeat protein